MSLRGTVCVSTFQQSFLPGLRDHSLCPLQLQNAVPESSSSRPRPDLWRPLRAEAAPRPPPAWEKPAQNPQIVKQEDDGFTGVSGTVTSHMGGKDSVWMARTTNSNSGGERQLLQGPGSGEVRSPALRVGTLQVPRLR